MSGPVRIGVIGMGRFGRLHSLTLAGLAEAELVAVVARRQASLDEIHAELPNVPGYLDLDQAMEESGAEAWVVACTTAAHVGITRRLLESGKKVLLEKPISEDLEEARSLAPLVSDDPANLMIGHIVLFNSEYQQLREEVSRRGKISYIDSVRHRPASIVADFAGENPLHAAMVHDLYAVQILLNRAEPEHFSCQFHRTDAGAVDLAVAQLKWPDGTLASFAASYLTPNGMPPRGIDRTEVYGQGWAARILCNPRPIEVWTEERAEWPMALEVRVGGDKVAGMLAEELRCFCRIVRGQEQVPVGATFQDALQVQQWMERLESVAV